MTGDGPGPSWKTGSRINYHQSGDELLEYIITNMNNTLPCTELSFMKMGIIHLKMCLTLGFWIKTCSWRAVFGCGEGFCGKLEVEGPSGPQPLAGRAGFFCDGPARRSCTF